MRMRRSIDLDESQQPDDVIGKLLHAQTRRRSRRRRTHTTRRLIVACTDPENHLLE